MPTGQYIRDFIQRRLPATLFEDTQYTYVHVKDVAETIVKVLEKPENIGQKYIIGKHRMSIGQINQLLNEITGAPIPRWRIPGILATVTAAFCTLVANLTKKPPPWGMCSDQIRSMKESIVADGSKRAWRAKTRPPSFINYQTMAKLLEGHQLGDTVAILGSLNIIAAELDR